MTNDDKLSLYYATLSVVMVIMNILLWILIVAQWTTLHEAR